MADLTFTQGADPVTVVNDSSGNQLSIDSSGNLTPNLSVDRTGSGTIIANNGTVIANTQGSSTISVQISGIWVATLSFQASIDGTNFYSISVLDISNNNIIGGTLINRNIVFNCGGYAKFQVIATPFTSGTVSITWNVGAGTNTSAVFNTVAANFLAQVAQSGTWTVQPGNTPNTAPWLISQTLATKTLYSAATNNLTPPATPTDIVTITGSGTKTIRVLAIELFPTQTLSGTNTFFIVKRSTANSAGTSTTPTIVAHDSNNAAATAVVRQYTANPTLGTTVGTVLVAKVTTPAPGGLVGEGFMFDFTRSGFDSGLVLRGTGEVLALNFNGAALPGGLNINANVIFLEE